MSFVEFIGFVVSLAAMIFLAIKRFYDEQQRRKNPQEYARKEKKREENLRKFFQQQGIDFGNGEVQVQKSKTTKRPVQPPKAPSREQKPQAFQQKKSQQSMSWEHYGTNFSNSENITQNIIEQGLNPSDAFGVHREEKKTAGNLVLNNLKSPRDMLIIKEIFDKPLSMRSSSQNMNLESKDPQDFYI